MRVVHVLRDAYAERPGGDVVHLDATVAAVREHGVDAVASTWADAPAATDIVHIYNIPDASEMIDHALEARARWPGVRVVITPIFWPWSPRTVVRARDAAMAYRVTRNLAKQAITWSGARRALSDADAVLSLSAGEATHTRRFFRLRRHDHIQVVPSGIWLSEWNGVRRPGARDELLERIGARPDVRTVVACAGRLEPRKNQRALVRAAASLGDVAVVLTGANGSSSYGDGVVDLAARSLPQRTAWLGRVDFDTLRTVLAGADAHALVSYQETAGIASLEAAAAGCEVIAAADGPAREYLGDGAHYCDVGSVSSIAAAIDEARTTPRRDHLAARLPALDWPVIGATIAKVYASLM